MAEQEERGSTAAPQDATSQEPSRSPPLLEEHPIDQSGQPGGGKGRVDVTGLTPEGVHVDPDITEGHPGYEESGDSEISFHPDKPR
jgi:hypothetical protein